MTVSQSFPSANQPFVDRAGHITRPWRSLLSSFQSALQTSSTGVVTTSFGVLTAYAKNPFAGGSITLSGAYQYLELKLTKPAIINPPASLTDSMLFLIKDMTGSVSATNTATFTGKLDGQTNRVLKIAYSWFFIRYSVTAGAWGQL